MRTFRPDPGNTRSPSFINCTNAVVRLRSSWWWAEILHETRRVIIPIIKLELIASVGFIHKEWLPLILTNFCFSYWDTDTATGLHFRISHPLPTSGNFKISMTSLKQGHTLTDRKILVFCAYKSHTKNFSCISDRYGICHIWILILKMSWTYQCLISFSKPISEFLLTLSCVAMNYYICCTR
jgi:hypothetical protein